MVPVKVNEAICAGCHVCELACSFHHLEAFSPRRSSIEIRKNSSAGAIAATVYDQAIEFRIACDGCIKLKMPACAAWCPANAISVVTI